MSVTVETVTEGVTLRRDAVIVRRASLDHDVTRDALLVHSARAVSIAASVKTRHHVTMWAELAPVRLAGLERSVKKPVRRVSTVWTVSRGVCV